MSKRGRKGKMNLKPTRKKYSEQSMPRYQDKSTGDIHDARCRTDRIENYLKEFSKDFNNAY